MIRKTLFVVVGLLASLVASGFMVNTSTLKRRRWSSHLDASNTNELTPMRKGSTVALITPMTSTGQVDVESLRQILQFHIAQGTDNLCILGTTGEASTLSMPERATVLQTVVEECKGRIPILAGIGTIDPNHVKDMTLQALELGCDAGLLVTPYYVKPPQRGLIQHAMKTADFGLPIVLYNVPGRTGVNFLDENMAICAQHDNIIGIKDATGDLKRVQNMRTLLRDDSLSSSSLLLYSGDDNTSLEFVRQGGDGCISVTANVAPSIMHDMMKTTLQGQSEQASQLNDQLLTLHKNLFCESNPIPVKWAVQRMGLIQSAYCRPPLDTLDPALESTVEDALRQAGLLS